MEQRVDNVEDIGEVDNKSGTFLHPNKVGHGLPVTQVTDVAHLKRSPARRFANFTFKHASGRFDGMAYISPLVGISEPLEITFKN